MEMSVEEIQKLESSLKSEFGFLSEEIKFVMRHKPTFLMW